jgi:hypothetical protein
VPFATAPGTSHTDFTPTPTRIRKIVVNANCCVRPWSVAFTVDTSVTATNSGSTTATETGSRGLSRPRSAIPTSSIAKARSDGAGSVRTNERSANASTDIATVLESDVTRKTAPTASPAIRSGARLDG